MAAPTAEVIPAIAAVTAAAGAPLQHRVTAVADARHQAIAAADAQVPAVGADTPRRVADLRVAAADLHTPVVEAEDMGGNSGIVCSQFSGTT